jgi:hypothetical protein
MRSSQRGMTGIKLASIRGTIYENSVQIKKINDIQRLVAMTFTINSKHTQNRRIF